MEQQKTKTIRDVIDAIRAHKCRGKWSEGVKEYALEMLEREDIDADAPADTLNAGELLNHVGAIPIKIGMFHGYGVWGYCRDVSWGGNFRIYNDEVAQTLCTPATIKRKTRKDGTLARPSKSEDWLDLQARALRAALVRIQWTARGVY